MIQYARNINFAKRISDRIVSNQFYSTAIRLSILDDTHDGRIEKPMKTGVCPKCHSTEVYRGASTDGDGLSTGTYNAVVEINVGKTQMTLWVDTFLCRACGYLEMYVANRDDLRKLSSADGWEKV